MNSDPPYKKGNSGRSPTVQKQNDIRRVIISIFLGAAFGFFVGMSFPKLSLTKAGNLVGSNYTEISQEASSLLIEDGNNNSTQSQNITELLKIWVPTNPRGAERLPPRIVATESDLFFHKLYGDPRQDLTHIPKYLVAFTVGIKQKQNIDAAVKKFSENFTILLFHYDGNTSEWDEFEWSKRAIHVSARKQTKWWYAKRFLHPSVVAPYDYIFIWDEDLGVEHFDAEEYIKLMKKYGLEISQPGLDPTSGSTAWPLTKRKADHEVHKSTDEEKPGRCPNPLRPPCAAFVEIMAPVFSRDAWQCVWHMIQNDLVHGWGIDLAFQYCFDDPHEKIGVVDAQWVVHQSVPSLGAQGTKLEGKTAWRAVRERCDRERSMFKTRLAGGLKSYYWSKGIDPASLRIF